MRQSLGSCSARQPFFESISTTDVLTINEQLRVSRCTGNRAKRAIGEIPIQLQLFCFDTGIPQQSPGFRTELTTITREQRYIERP